LSAKSTHPRKPDRSRGYRLAFPCRVGARVQVRAVSCGVDLQRVYAHESWLSIEHAGLALELPLVALMRPGPCAVALSVCPDSWSVPAAWKGPLEGPLADLRANPGRHDGMLTALIDLRTAEGTYVGQVAPVSYFATRALESLLDGVHALRHCDQPREGRLPEPSESVMACDIGVVVLLKTSDDIVVAQRRAGHLDWRAGHLSVSASGSLEPARDFDSPVVGLDGLLAGARRELAEELGVGGVHDPCADQLQMTSLGIWRELERGGKPELYAAASTPLSFQEVCMLHARAPDASESDTLHGLARADRERLLADVIEADGLLQRSDGPVDLALVAALLLSRDAAHGRS